MDANHPLPTSLFALLLATTLLAPLAAAAPPEPVEGAYVVGFYSMPGEARAGRYADEAVTHFDDALRFAVVHAKNARGFEERAKHDPNVRYVQAEVYAEVDATANDPYYAQQFGLAKINAPAAWDITRGATSVTVAVVDTGVDRAHVDLAGTRLLTGYDFMANDADVTDDCGHGTGVTGVVGASANNGVGVAGVAQVTIMPLKALGMNPDGRCYGPFSAVASSIRYATDNGARVISMSLGAVGVYDQATNDAINYAYSRGVLLVASAGNNGPCTNCVAWPAAHPNVVAVAATDSTNAQAYFSSTGPEVELAAPGKSIYTTYRNNAYGLMSGTSLAAPHVSGVAALALSANPALTNVELRARLHSSAKDLGAVGFDQTFGYGLVDAAALLGAGGSPPPPPPPANAAPVASFTASASGLTASVTANASYDTDGAIVDYRWSWGDGLSFSTGDCAWSGHTYATAGTYTITLTVTDNAGATASTTRTVSVTAPNAAPTASFSATTSDLTASVDGRASSDPDGSIASWSWAWGDGAATSGSTSSHAYGTAGTYTVTLTVSDNLGATSVTTRTVTVTAPAPAPTPAPSMHVGDLTSSVWAKGKSERLTWTVTIVGASGAPVSGATVSATIGSTSYTGTTGTDGTAAFRLDVPKRAGVTYTLCVANVSLAGWTYDATANVATCRSAVTV